MFRTRSLKFIIAISLLVPATAVYACGESLFRVGKGVTFREYSAPLPGSILVVANTEGEMAMVERLRAAGHDIHIVRSPSDIGEELQRHEIDVVVAYLSDAPTVQDEMTFEQHATYIPVKRGKQQMDTDRYDEVLSSDDSVLNFLKAIHRTLSKQV
jgi:hypothetical protein